MKKILFIYNPKAGTGKKSFNVDWLSKNYNDFFEYEFVSTTGPNHATQIVESEKNNFDYFIAIGGDGTANEVGKVLVGSEKILGIIPTGSGNGLALELGAKKPNFNEPIQIKKANLKTIDTLDLNGEICLNVSGIGFDAEVAHTFKNQKTRGLFTYVYSTLISIFRYKPLTLALKMENEICHVEAFSISFANSRQFGNNAFIAPLAIMDDGLMDVSVLMPFPVYLAPLMAYKLFNKTIHTSRYFKGYKVKKAAIMNELQMNWHIDGEPVSIRGPVEIKVNKRSLRILTG